jgi:hypothetical protein
MKLTLALPTFAILLYKFCELYTIDLVYPCIEKAGS